MNKSLIFRRLGTAYGLAGIGVVILVLLTIFFPSVKVHLPVRIFSWFILAGVILHTTALALRWYISGFVPLTTIYEFMNLSSWLVIIAGLLVLRRSVIVSGASCLLASVTLYAAHLEWVNPGILNPGPLFGSLWFSVHSALTVAGYTFFALAAVLAVLNMMMMFLKRPKNKTYTDTVISKLTAFTETSLILGLLFLTAGTILGALWANESRGPVWDWDPSEAWALVTIIIYALILLLRQKQNLISEYIFNLMSVFGFASVIIAFFGVNLYMPGNYHIPGISIVPVPWCIYISLLILITLCILAFLNENKMRKLGKTNKRQF